MDLVRSAAVEKRVIDIGAAVIKSREEEAKFWSTDNLSGEAVVELVLTGVIAKLQLPVLHRADRAYKIAEHLIGLIVGSATARDIVCIIGTENKIIAVTHVKVFYDSLEK